MASPLSTTFPAVVYVPTADEMTSRDRRPALAHDLDGSAELFCFSSPERLRSFHGPATPWRRMSREQVHLLVETEGVVRCHLDPLPPSAPQQPAVPEQRPAALAAPSGPATELA